MWFHFAAAASYRTVGAVFPHENNCTNYCSFRILLFEKPVSNKIRAE